jgi:hypothetical protein
VIVDTAQFSVPPLPPSDVGSAYLAASIARFLMERHHTFARTSALAETLIGVAQEMNASNKYDSSVWSVSPTIHSSIVDPAKRF